MKFFVWAVALFFSLNSSISAADAISTLLPQAGVVVLRNGRVLTGSVISDGDQLVIKLAEKSIVRIPTSSVEYYGRDLRDAYHFKQQSIQRGNSSQVLDLAEWCLSQKLINEARHELGSALVIDPDNPRIPVIARRIQSIERNKTTSPRPSKPSTFNPTIDAKELDALVKELPPAVIEQFTSKIQPLLLNRCATSGCHGLRTASSFRLYRPVSGHLITRRFTQRNMFRALQRIETSDPARSPLLKVPKGPHGSAEHAIFKKDDQKQYAELAAWVELSARSIAGDRSRHASRNAPLTIPTFNRPERPVSYQHELRGSAKPSPQQQTQKHQPLPGSSNSYNTVPEQQEPRQVSKEDPFDPEVFNRRFFKKPIQQRDKP